MHALRRCFGSAISVEAPEVSIDGAPIYEWHVDLWEAFCRLEKSKLSGSGNDSEFWMPVVINVLHANVAPRPYPLNDSSNILASY